MSVSENSTLLPPIRESDGSYQLLDGHAYGLGDLAVNSYDKSPYTDPDIICLDVGPAQTRFRIHRMILSQSVELESKPALKLWGEKTNDIVVLPELDPATAHTLVHYLYTGRYQALRDGGDDDDSATAQAEKAAIARYRLGTSVYAAAVRYKLPGLVDLAKGRIAALGEDLSILEMLSVARESAFPLLPDDETWFAAYVEEAIRGAVSEDPELFMRPGFVDQIEGDRKFRQVIMRSIVNTYSRGPAVQSPGREQGAVSKTVLGDVSSPRLEEQPLQQDVKEVGVTSAEHVVDATVEAQQLPANPLPTPENGVDSPNKQAAGSPQAPEPFTDELGFGNSKMYQQLGKKSEEGANEAPVQISQSPSAAHKRSDSVMQVEEVVPSRDQTVACEPVTGVSDGPATSTVATEEVSSTGTTPSKKKSKNKKKKNAASAVAN